VTATLAAADSAALRISTGAWSDGVSTRAGSSQSGSSPSFPSPLAAFVRPLEDLLDMFTGNPGAVYRTSSEREGTTGDIADVNTMMTRLANEVMRELSGKAAQKLEAALRYIAECAHSISNWTKAVSQALQVCVTIFESVRSLASEALRLLSGFVESIGDVVFGSWPWEVSKKADAIKEFARSVERFVKVCTEAANNALKAARELVRLITDLYRAIVPFHEELEAMIAKVVALVPGGTPPTVRSGEHGGPNGALYNPSHTPYAGSDLRIVGDYTLGYKDSYDLVSCAGSSL